MVQLEEGEEKSHGQAQQVILSQCQRQIDSQSDDYLTPSFSESLNSERVFLHVLLAKEGHNHVMLVESLNLW